MRTLAPLLVLLVLVVPTVAAAAAPHEPLGARPYAFPDRSPQSALILQRNRGSSSGGTAGIGALSTTYAVGNWTQINMTLGDGATGTISNVALQNNWGNSTATSNVQSQNAGGDQAIDNGGGWTGYSNSNVGTSSSAGTGD
jgi:hypothetical protein